MPPPSSPRPPGGAQSLADPPGEALRDAERHDVGGITAEGGIIPIAAVEANAASRWKGLGLGSWLAIGWLVFVVAMALLAPILPIGDPSETIHLERPCPTVERLNREVEQCTIQGKGPLSSLGTARGHPLGGDNIGRSMGARLVYGARTSLVVAVGAVAVGFVIGGMMGLIAGYFGGRVDTLISGVMNVLLSLPAIILALALVAFLRNPSSEGSGDASTLPSEVILIIAIGVVAIPLLGRITRGSTISWAQREFVLAARAQGAKNMRIMFREVLPNVLPAMLSIALLGIAVAIVAEGALSILGLGVQPPGASWGNLIGQGRGSLEDSPHIVLEPSILIFVTVLSLNYLGDVVRARFDVREAGI